MRNSRLWAPDEPAGDPTRRVGQEDRRQVSDPDRPGAAPQGQGRDRLRGSIVLILVLLAIFAPAHLQDLGHRRPDDAPDGGTDLDLHHRGYPTIGPPFYPFTWDHPLGLAPSTAYDNLARLLYGLRTSLFIAHRRDGLQHLIGIVDRPGRRLRPRLRSTGSSPSSIDVFLSFPFLLGALALAPIITARFATNAGQAQVGPVLLADRACSSSSAGWAWPG